MLLLCIFYVTYANDVLEEPIIEMLRCCHIFYS